MNEKVKDFLITQGVTERDIEYRGNFTFLKVELMLLNALRQGQTLPIDNVVLQSEQLADQKRYCNGCGDYVGKGCDNKDCKDFNAN
jgi:hypothetical protein